MRFFMPTKIYVERNAVQNHQKELASVGTRALIVTGKYSAKLNGSLDDVLNALTQQNIPYKIFNQVEENPSVETVVTATEMGKFFGANFVIGIGGGSPIDAAKATALLMANPNETEECLYMEKPLKYLPVVAVPTTCGTGSEATPTSVLTNRKLHFKKSITHKIFPTLSLVDWKYLAFAKKELIVNTAVDALSHLVESYLNSQSNVLNRMNTEYGLMLWAKNKDALLSDSPVDVNLYETLMLASTIAGISIAHTSTSVPHGMSYDLTYNYGVSHGKAVGMFLGVYVEVCAKAVPEDVQKVLSLLQIKDLAEFTTMLKKLVGTFSLPRNVIQEFSTAMKKNQSKLQLAPCKITSEEIDAMYERALEIKD